MDLGDAELRTPPGGLEGRALVLNHRVGVQRQQYSGILQGLSSAGRQQPVDAIEFALLNFPDYIGLPVRFGSADQPSVAGVRLHLRSHGWRVDVDQVRDCEDRLKSVRAQGGFALTHAGQIRRAPEKPISYAIAEDFLLCLHFFFAFLAGHWTGPVLTIGRRERQIVWRRYGSWIVTPSVQPRSWFPTYAPHKVRALFGQFRRLWNDSIWNRAIRTAVVWYVQANAGSAFTESSIVASSISLELLAWMVVVESGGHLTGSQFKKLEAAERVGRLLDHSDIPRAIPDNFAILRRSALARNEKTGPRCLATVRNAVVHPRRAKRRVVGRIDPMILFELKELALSYVELAFLNVLDYKGQYARRRFSGFKADQIVGVPWV